MIRFLRDDVVPVFIGSGRGSLGLSRTFYREFGIVSRVFALREEGDAGKAPFFRAMTVGEEVLPLALRDLASTYPVGRSLLLLPGNLRGAALLPALAKEMECRYLAGGEGAFPVHVGIRPGDGIVTGYAATDGHCVFSRTGRVLSVTADGKLPTVIAPEAITADVLVPKGYCGFFTLTFGEQGTFSLPYLADGGFLLARSGLSAPAAVIGDRVLCEETVPHPLGEGETDFAPAPLWRCRRGDDRKAPVLFARRYSGAWTLAPRFRGALPWDRA